METSINTNLELMDVLSKKAYSMGVRLSLSNVSNLAIEHLNLSVREFWANYKLYLIGSFGHDDQMLETFEKTKMGQIVALFAKLYGKKTVYEEIVRDVLWEFEDFYAREYGADISDLEALVSQFETKKDGFETDEHYKILQKIIEVEKSEEGVMVMTSLVNDDSSSLDAVWTSPMKCPSKKNVLLEEKSFLATPVKYEGGKIDFIEQEELEVSNERLEESEMANKCMTAEDKTQVLKDRAKKLRKLRKESKPIKDSNGKTDVEIDEYGRPNGKGRRELVHYLTVKTLATFPTGIIVSSKYQEHHQDPSSEKIRELADTVAEKKMDVE